MLDGEGKRIMSKYYGTPHDMDATFAALKEQRQFEQQLWEKTRKSSHEIMMLDGYVVVYRNNMDVFLYVIGSAEENEVMLATVLASFYDMLHAVLKYPMFSYLYI